MKNVKVHDPFLLTCFQISIENWDEKKDKLLNLVDWKDPKSNSSVFFSDYFENLQNPDRKPKYLKSFINILKPELNSFLTSVEQSPITRKFGRDKIDLKMKIMALWAQRYTTGQNMNPHSHESTGYSAVLYAEFNEREHEATEFFAPFKNVVDTMDYRWLPKVKEGDILFFPSPLLHYSLPNKSRERRTIFSFNCNIIPANY